MAKPASSDASRHRYEPPVIRAPCVLAFVCGLPSIFRLELWDVPCLLRSHRIGLLRGSHCPATSPCLTDLLNEQLACSSSHARINASLPHLVFINFAPSLSPFYRHAPCIVGAMPLIPLNLGTFPTAPENRFMVPKWTRGLNVSPSSIMTVSVAFIGRACCIEPFQLHIIVTTHQKQLPSCALGQTGSRTQPPSRLIV